MSFVNAGKGDETVDGTGDQIGDDIGNYTGDDMTMTLNYTVLDLPLHHAFTISRGTRTVASNVLIELTDGQITAYGECAPNARYHESATTVLEGLQRFDPQAVSNPFDLVALQGYLQTLYPQEGSIRAGIEMAYADYMGKFLRVPLHRLWNAPTTIGPVTSFTIGIDSEQVIREKVEKAAPYPILKVKLGTDHDRDIIRVIREHTDKVLWVDANEGWKDLDEAIALTQFMQAHQVQLIEQPMPASMVEELCRLKQASPLPLIADEGCTGSEAMETVARAYHGINIKLMKTGGMVPALQLCWNAKQRGLQVMVGCMLESSLANTAAAIVATWADYCDLDGHKLIADDPFDGLKIREDGRIILNDRHGLGVLPIL